MNTILTSDERYTRPFAMRCARWLSLALPVALSSCSSREADVAGSDVATVHEAVEGASCGYAVSAEIQGVSKVGFLAKLEIKNVSGPTGQSFSLFVDPGAALIKDVAHGSAEATEGGYVLRPVGSLEESQLDPGESYQFQLKLDGEYTELETFVHGANGANCDQESPTVELSVSENLFTSDGTLHLAADAADNVSLQKVVFSRDGEVIGQDSTPPYALDVPVTSALDGRHRFMATAYDISGNSASETERVLVAIDGQFFGTAVSSSADQARLLDYFDQITPENAGKWGVAEPARDQMNWAELDAAYAFAETNGLPFKFHTLVWGSQQPSWLSALTPEEQLGEIDEWMAEVAARYPGIDLIDVVNEPMNTPAGYAAALGGAGVTGYDWVIKAFEMARGHFPNAELLVNEYNTVVLPEFTANYLRIVNLLKDRGLVDGIGEQAHFLERVDVSVVASNLDALAATGLPIYVTELDVNFANDARQAERMSTLFPVLWEHPSVVGVTHWGFRQGAMWRPDAYLLRSDGSERPALTWLECYLGGNSNCPVPTYVPVERTGDSTAIVLEAEDYDAAQGLLALGNVVAYTDDGDWLSFDKVAFNANWDSVSVSYAKGNTTSSNITVHLDSPGNAAVATIALPSTGSWGTSATVSMPWLPISGERKVFVRFNGGFGVANVDSIRFGAPAGTGQNVVANGTFESGTGGWFSWNGGTLIQSSARFHGGTKSLLVTNRANNAPAATSLTSVVKPGGTYPMSLWVSIDSTDGTSKQINVTRKIACAGQSDSYSWVGNPVTVADDGQWVKISGTLTIPQCTLTDVQLYVEGGSGADLYVDDVQVIDASLSNLLTDGTFESGIGGWFGWNNTSLLVTNTWAHSGLQSLVSANRTQNGTLARTITNLVAPGKRYQGSFWVSVTNIGGSGTTSVNVTKKITCDGNTTYTWLGQSDVSNGQWAQIAGVVDLGACSTVGEVTLYAEGPSSGDLYVDDVTLSLAQ
jgi:endo-1,4-beta-xylanase